MNWSMLPMTLFGLLNIFLVFSAPQQAKGAEGAAFVFGGAATLILAGLWRNNLALVLTGCVLGILAPIWMGFLMRGHPNPVHVAVRLVIVALFFWLWIKFRPS